MRRNRLSHAIRLSLCLSAFGLAGAVSAQGTTFVAQPPISTTASGVRSVFAIDLDGDGDQDVLSAWSGNDRIAWYENDGNADPGFSLRTIATNADLAVSVFAIDLDGDGDQDVLSASIGDDKIAWYENDGAQNFTLRTIATNADGARSVFAIDLDGDGDPDVLSASSDDDTIVWYENDGNADPSFTLRTISANADSAESVYAIDLDGDGDQDPLSASFNDDTIAWYENDGAADPVFTVRTIATNANGAQSVFAIDLDGDGDQDVLSASFLGNTVAWYENDGNADPSFTLRTIATNANRAISLSAIDLDGDGDPDVLSALRNDDTVVWYENDGNAEPDFSPRTIATNADLVYSVFAIDLDGDGDPDVLSASRDDDKIAWYENQLVVSVNLSVSFNAGTEAATTAITVSATADAAVNGDQTVDVGVAGPGITAGDFTLSDTTITIPDGLTAGQVTFTVIDDNIFEGPETATLTISNPSDGVVLGTNISEDIAIADNEAAPSVTLASFDMAMFSENGGTTTLTITTSNPSTTESCFTVSFGGTAAEGVDFTSADDDGVTPGTQVCVAGDSTSTTGSIVLTGVDDGVFEGDETLTATVDGQIAGTIIVDNEAAPNPQSLVFNPATFNEEGGTTTLTLTQSVAATTEQCFTVAYAGSATLDTDYSSTDDEPATGVQICIAPNDTTGTVVLTGIDDAVFEGDETVTASSGGQTAEASITDDEAAPAVESLVFNPASFSEEGGTSVLTLTQSGIAAAEQCVTVTFTGSAIEGVDYTVTDDSADTGTQVCVAPGDTTGDIILTGIADAEFEGVGFETVTASSGVQTAEARINDANEPIVIPTLNVWGLGILASLMAWLGFRRRR